MSRRRISCYCAFCRMPRKVYRKPGLTPVDVSGAVALAVVTGLLIWEKLDPRMVVISVIYVIILESLVLVRRRVEVACPHCGFDALIYGRDPAKACELVKTHLQNRSEDPRTWLKESPALHLPTRHPSKTPKKTASQSTRHIVG